MMADCYSSEQAQKNNERKTIAHSDSEYNARERAYVDEKEEKFLLSPSPVE